MESRWNAATPILLITTIVFMFASVWMTLIYAPDEKIMGPVQRIFYFHVPAALVTYSSVFILLGASMAYLWTRRSVFDHVSRAATEVGLLFCTMVLVTGPIWARPAWGVWWTWEARLTTTLVLWLLLASCLMVRRYATERETGGRLAAVLGIIAALDVPIVHKAVEWWRGQHPQVFGPGKKAPLAPEMMEAFLVSAVAFFLLLGLLVLIRTRLATLEDRAQSLSERAAGEGT